MSILCESLKRLILWFQPNLSLDLNPRFLSFSFLPLALPFNSTSNLSLRQSYPESAVLTSHGITEPFPSFPLPVFHIQPLLTLPRCYSCDVFCRLSHFPALSFPFISSTAKMSFSLCILHNPCVAHLSP